MGQLRGHRRRRLGDADRAALRRRVDPIGLADGPPRRRPARRPDADTLHDDRDVSSPAFARSLRRPSPNLAAPTLVGISGLVLAPGHEWGLYLAALGIILVLITGVTNSWLFLLRPDQAERRGA